MMNSDGSTHRVYFHSGGWMNCHCVAAGDHWEVESSVERRARELLEEHCPSGDYERSDVLDAIRAAASPQWEPIDSAPKDGTPVLLDHQDWHSRVLRGGWDAHEKAWRTHGFGCPATQPSHWMPLPAAPEVGV